LFIGASDFLSVAAGSIVFYYCGILSEVMKPCSDTMLEIIDDDFSY
jgi:hypothetical protein